MHLLFQNIFIGKQTYRILGETIMNIIFGSKWQPNYHVFKIKQKRANNIIVKIDTRIIKLAKGKKYTETNDRTNERTNEQKTISCNGTWTILLSGLQFNCESVNLIPTKFRIISPKYTR